MLARSSSSGRVSVRIVMRASVRTWRFFLAAAALNMASIPESIVPSRRLVRTANVTSCPLRSRSGADEQKASGRFRCSAAKASGSGSTHTPRQPRSRSRASVLLNRTPSLAPTSTKVPPRLPAKMWATRRSWPSCAWVAVRGGERGAGQLS